MTNPSNRDPAAELRRLLATCKAPMLRPTTAATRAAHATMALRFRKHHAQRLRRSIAEARR